MAKEFCMTIAEEEKSFILGNMVFTACKHPRLSPKTPGDRYIKLRQGENRIRIKASEVAAFIEVLGRCKKFFETEVE